MNESIKAGSDIHAGDGGYSIGTQEKYNEFVKFRNKSRIQKLAEQAKKYALDSMIKITDREQALKVYSETYDTKFAELIVKEMLQTCEDHPAWTGRMIGEEIKEHFRS